MQNRQSALKKWLRQILGPTQFSLDALFGDASFRQYYRLHFAGFTRIVMDAPPDKETLTPFLAIAAIFRANGLRAPQVYAADEQQGFVVLDDFGDILLLNKLSLETADSLYKSAINTLIVLQQCPTSGSYAFPCFDTTFILAELNVFTHWFVQAYLKINLTSPEEKLINQTFEWLSAEVFNQPQVLIHRDYHSRNIMLPDQSTDERLGIIDFQDAMIGPFTYDLVSMLKDCYIQWPRSNVMAWLTFFYEQSPIAQKMPFPLFVRAFDLCGLQRHLKVLGVFCRLYLRDNKANYLNDLPLTLHYVFACLETYEELLPFFQFIQQRIQLP